MVRDAETYNRSLDYSTMAQFRAVVEFPYDTSLMFFWEFYSMNMPTFVPRALWRWGMYGQHTRPDLAGERADSNKSVLGFADGPFFDAWAPHDVDRSLVWSQFTDWAMFPYILYFQSLPELLEMVRDTAMLVDTSKKMEEFNKESIVMSIEVWRRIAGRFLSVR